MFSVRNQIQQYYLKQGYIYFSRSPVTITKILGTCVAVCLYDRANHYGGMNHFLLPAIHDGIYSARYGDASMHKLISLFVQAGSSVHNMEAKLFGGAAHRGSTNAMEIASSNIFTARHILQEYHIRITEISTGGYQGRKVVFNTQINNAYSQAIEYSGQFSESEKHLHKGVIDEKSKSPDNRRFSHST